MENMFDNLNGVQREAVENTEGPNLIIAGAGSGKTRVLTCKIALLMLNGVSPRSVLALTFTNKAAKEMKERIAGIAGEQSSRLWAGTFHSVFSRILRAEAASTGFDSNFTIYDTTDSLSVIRGIIKELNLDDKTYKDRDVLGRISMAKNYLMTPAAYSSSVQLTGEDAKMRRPGISEIYTRYAAKCRNANSMDFDDILLYTNILLRDSREILDKYRQMFRYILVDEYQDTNMSQYHIIKSLASLHRNITAVGDDAQSIYSFRGARIENILNFKKDYPDYAEYKLEQNYRSTKTIVNAANSVISKNRVQLKKNCFSEGDTGDKLELIAAFSDQEEGLLVAGSIVETVYAKHAEYSGMAILYRTNAQSRIFEDALRRKNIPYRIYGGLSFYQRAEIKDALAYMRLAANPNDDEAFRRIVNYPARGIGDTTMDRIQEYASRNAVSLWNTIAGVPMQSIGIKENIAGKISDFARLINSFMQRIGTDSAYDFASSVVKKSGIYADLKANKTPEGVSKLENIEELLNGIQEYAASQEEKTATIYEYLQNVSLITGDDRESPDDRNKVSLMTVHSSKGLEFDYVYIVGVEEGLFPGTLSAQSEHDLEEERRLFYVALTRAAVKVVISCARTRFRYGNLVSSAPSRFIRDIDRTCLSTPVSENIHGDGYGSQKPAFQRREDYGKFQPVKADQPATVATAAVSMSAIRVGAEVEHERFGQGTVAEIEGYGSDVKIKIDFSSSGRKTLLLKYAKLTVKS